MATSKRRSSLTSTADDAEVLQSLLSRKKSFHDISVVGARQEQQIVRYDHEQLADLRVILQPWSRGSIFRRASIWWQIFFYVALAGSIAALFDCLVKAPADINPDAVSKVSNYFNTFLPFLFGIYLNNIFNRWWAMRTQGVGGINQSLNSMVVIMASQHRGADSEGTKKLLLRYGLLIHELVYRAARKTDGNLEDLVNSGMLKFEEYGIITEMPAGPARPQALWVWVQLLWDGLLRQKQIKWHVHQVALHLVSEGRAATKSIFTHLNTQIPFAYVHLMACLVHINLFILALQSGMIIAKAVGMIIVAKHSPAQAQATMDTEASTLLIAQLIYLALVPVLYLGFLALSQEIADPFGTDLNDFPRAQFHNVMQDENEAIIQMADNIPPELLPFVLSGPDKSDTGSADNSDADG